LNVTAYPKWQEWMREKQSRLMVLWGKHDISFDLGEPEHYREDVPSAESRIRRGHFVREKRGGGELAKRSGI
jgi:hypothetical protein